MANERISVIKVGEILMVTMPADPDDSTITALQEEVLHAMARYEASGLILDISAIETMDSFFARTVVETTRMVELMGGKTVIAGMRPSVAITATQLGFTFGNTKTALDVDYALDLLGDRHPRRPGHGR